LAGPTSARTERNLVTIHRLSSFMERFHSNPPVHQQQCFFSNSALRISPRNGAATSLSDTSRRSGGVSFVPCASFDARHALRPRQALPILVPSGRTISPPVVLPPSNPRSWVVD
jgi:hypothetical protein